MRRLSTSEGTVDPAGYAKPEELDADRAIKEHALIPLVIRTKKLTPF